MKLNGKLIQEKRQALPIPMTAPELAKVVGITPRQINKIEGGTSTKRSTAERIAKAIKTPLVDLIHREKEVTANG